MCKICSKQQATTHRQVQWLKRPVSVKSSFWRFLGQRHKPPSNRLATWQAKFVIDCINPFKPDLSGLEIGHTLSGAEKVAEWAKGAKVFKAFNTTGANIMADPVIHGIRTVMLVCGDDEAAKPVVLRLANDVGFDVVDAGKLKQARLLEPWAMLWVSLAFGAVGRDFGFALLRRDTSKG